MIGLLCGVTVLCRSIGIALVPVVLWKAWRAKKPWWWMLLGMAVTIGPWVLWSRTSWGDWNKDAWIGYYTDYLGWWQQGSLSSLGQVARDNFLGLDPKALQAVKQEGTQPLPGIGTGPMN